MTDYKTIATAFDTLAAADEGDCPIECMMVRLDDGKPLMLYTLIEANQESLTAYDALHLTALLLRGKAGEIPLGNGDKAIVTRA